MQALENRLGRAPDDAETAAEIGISLDEYRTSLADIARSSVAALDELWFLSSGDGDTVSLLDTLEDPHAEDPALALRDTDRREMLRGELDHLPPRERLVLQLYYYEELTLREIGEVLGVTESRVSQLHTKAILRLKARLAGPLPRGGDV